MLTADLVRARIAAGVVRPRFVDAEDAALQGDAMRLVDLFEAHVGGTVGALSEAIADLIGDSTDYLLVRGLAKLLMDGSEVRVVSARSPEEVRTEVFRQAALAWPVRPGGGGGYGDRDAAITAAAVALELTPEEVEEALFADLKDAQRLVSAKTMAPDVLLRRYNVALAQAVLLRARQVRVTLTGWTAKEARQLLRFVKFRRLMHSARRVRGGYELVLDGPLSILKQTTKYGLGLALFLPGLLLQKRWKLEADVAWGQERIDARFELDDATGLVSHLQPRGTWESDEERHFRAQWKKLKTPWKLSRSARLIDLGGRGVWVPDFQLKHPDGRRALLEIVWFWTRQRFERQLELLRAHGPSGSIIALATRYRADRESTPPDVGAMAVYPFKGVIQAKKVLALAETAGVTPASG